VNGDHPDVNGTIVKTDFQYYTLPCLWDDYRDKFGPLGMVSPDVTVDVIRSLVEPRREDRLHPDLLPRGPRCAGLIYAD
jgi:putative alpha-1,2-mannosidase